MRHAIIVGHPSPDSFTLSVARAYQDAVAELGQTSIVRDLYRLDFDPRLRAAEIPGPAGFAPGEDVEAERALLGEADVFAFVYPLWFYVPPAIVTGYVQRVFGMGFGHGATQHGASQPLLRPRRMISFSSSGSPAEWLRTEGAWEAVKAIFDQHLAEVCGLTLLDHYHFGRILGSTPQQRIEAHLRAVRLAVQQHFGPQP